MNRRAFLSAAAGLDVFSTRHAIQPALPTLVKDVQFEYIEDVVLLDDEGAGLIDFVDYRRDGRPLRPEDVRLACRLPGLLVRFQNGSEAWRIDAASTPSEISIFYPVHAAGVGK